MSIYKRLLFTLALGLLLASCHSSHVVYVQETSAGFALGFGPDLTQKVSLGYDRDLSAVVPKKQRDKDAMSVFAIHSSTISGLSDFSFAEFVATGDAAVKIATQPDAVSKIRKKIYGEAK